MQLLIQLYCGNLQIGADDRSSTTFRIKVMAFDKRLSISQPSLQDGHHPNFVAAYIVQRGAKCAETQRSVLSRIASQCTPTP